MSDIPPARKNIQIEATRFRAAVSENFAQTMGGTVNFINDYQYDTKAWFINGTYGSFSTPQTFVDGIYVVPVKLEIFFVAMYIITAGSSGSTEFDILQATDGGGFASIFTTKPKITAASGSGIWVYTGIDVTPYPGSVAPVLTTTPLTINQFNGLACNMTQIQGGDPQGAGVIIYTRPIS